jgi:hypothetical protein
MAAVVEELQYQLLAREQELTRWDEALAAWEASLIASERAVRGSCITNEAEQAKTKTVQ